MRQGQPEGEIDRRGVLSGLIGLMVASRAAVDRGLDWRALWSEHHRRAFDTARGVLADEQLATFRRLILGIDLKADAGALTNEIRAVAGIVRAEARDHRHRRRREPMTSHSDPAALRAAQFWISQPDLGRIRSMPQAELDEIEAVDGRRMFLAWTEELGVTDGEWLLLMVAIAQFAPSLLPALSRWRFANEPLLKSRGFGS